MKRSHTCTHPNRGLVTQDESVKTTLGYRFLDTKFTWLSNSCRVEAMINWLYFFKLSRGVFSEQFKQKKFKYQMLCWPRLDGWASFTFPAIPIQLSPSHTFTFAYILLSIQFAKDNGEMRVKVLFVVWFSIRRTWKGNMEYIKVLQCFWQMECSLCTHNTVTIGVTC